MLNSMLPPLSDDFLGINSPRQPVAPGVERFWAIYEQIDSDDNCRGALSEELRKVVKMLLSRQFKQGEHLGLKDLGDTPVKITTMPSGFKDGVTDKDKQDWFDAYNYLYDLGEKLRNQRQ